MPHAAAHPPRVAQRGAHIHLGLEHIAAEYRRPELVATRRDELVRHGYPLHVASLVVRLEGRENTLLDGLSDRAFTEPEFAELKVLQSWLQMYASEYAPPYRPPYENAAEDQAAWLAATARRAS
jgi:hypothetical protein